MTDLAYDPDDYKAHADYLGDIEELAEMHEVCS